jgi:lipopolysaccharide/colanic/teichoic acid biosynthesis glycosyltransferase
MIGTNRLGSSSSVLGAGRETTISAGVDAGERRLDRAFNCISAGMGLLILSPVLLGIAVLVKLLYGGPVFYCPERAGKMNTLFRLYKFRTMIQDADRVGPAITSAGDKRVTPFGRLLRRYKLDELPQLINVLIGDMNFVGPRPEDPRYTNLYTEEQRRVLRFKPGITSPASLQFSREEELLTGEEFLTAYVNDILPRKIRLELEYFPNRTLGSDMKLIARTIAAIGKS